MHLARITVANVVRQLVNLRIVEQILASYPDLEPHEPDHVFVSCTDDGHATSLF